MTDNLLYSKLR